MDLDPFPRPGRPPPPQNATTKSYSSAVPMSASRHRRSLGSTVSAVVDHQIRSSKDDAGENPRKGSNGPSPSSYMPSFGGNGGNNRKNSYGSDAKDLQDVNEALEARLRMGTSRENSENGGRRGSGVFMGDLGSKPKPNSSSRANKGRNSLIEIGSGPLVTVPPPPPTAFPGKPNKGNISKWNEPEVTGSRKLSLGMSYGPITSSLDDQARKRAAANNMSSRPVQAGGGVLGSSMRRAGTTGQPRRSSLHTQQVRSGLTAAPLSGSIQKSWQQQVDAATARVAARGMMAGGETTANLGATFSQSKGGVIGRPPGLFSVGDFQQQQDTHYFPPGAQPHFGVGDRRGSSAANAVQPNTLTLDNWFGAGNGEENSYRRASPVGGGSSNGSSGRNSGLAPLPDTVDDYYGGGGGGNSLSLGPPSSVELRDMDELDQMNSLDPLARSSSMLMPQPRTVAGTAGGRPFSLELATSLRVLLFGSASRSFPQGWMGQSFNFSQNAGLSFGIVQAKGGPCGVLASVQAHLVSALCFGAPAWVDDTTRAVDPLAPTSSERGRALAAALAQILARCAGVDRTSGGEGEIPMTVVLPSHKAHFSGVGRYKADGITETLVMHEFASVGEVLAFTQDNIGFFVSEGTHACLSFLYSCLLTRGIANVSSDMDSEDLPLMGAHGYCSQEMVNLLLTGLAVSNTFDGDVVLEGEGKGGGRTVLRGIQMRSDVGFLSLFEHYMSCKVGERFKTPSRPVWVVCSESHFSVLFSREVGAEATSRASRRPPPDFVYYDGLARMEAPVVLTVDCATSSPAAFLDSDLVPPLEHCIRTKWRDAAVDWNGSEKIL